MGKNRRNVIATGVMIVVLLVNCVVVEDDVCVNSPLGITVEEAHRTFESSVKVFRLSPVRAFSKAVDEELLVVPLWNEASALNFESKGIVEVPLDAPTMTVNRVVDISPKKNRKWKYNNTVIKLIAEKDKNGEIFFTVVKITAEKKYLSKCSKKFKKSKLNMLNDFSGAIRYYTLQGELMSGAMYKSGKKVSSILPYDSTETESTGAQTRALEEQCEVYDIVYEEYYCIDVTVGDELLHQECDEEVCPVCGQYICACGDPADLPNVPDKYSKAPIQLMNKSKFVPWRKGANCLELSKEILKKYGQTNVGSSQHVFQLTVETDQIPIMKHWAKDPITVYENAIKSIDSHLNANRLIIAGINHSPGSSNVDGTDHFIVITGRGFDSGKQQYYYTFMDTATSNVDKGCDMDINRLYYREEVPWLSGRSAAINSGSSEITVTHIRPNDGDIEHTVALQSKIQE